mgnify:CR=1 FL=1|tara:strand:+ start:132 stop:581 length:450 start_codon:yes stop_codon:yes gene_type:complete
MKRSEHMLGGKNVKELTAGQAMENRVKSCHATTSWKDISLTLVDRGYGSLPVVDDDMNLLGIVSEDDLLEVLLDERDENKLKAEDIMTKNPTTVHEDMPILDVIKIVENNKLIRIPVTKGSTLVGIITRRDVLFCYIQGTNKPPHGFGS